MNIVDAPDPSYERAAEQRIRLLARSIGGPILIRLAATAVDKDMEARARARDCRESKIRVDPHGYLFFPRSQKEASSLSPQQYGFLAGAASMGTLLAVSNSLASDVTRFSSVDGPAPAQHTHGVAGLLDSADALPGGNALTVGVLGVAATRAFMRMGKLAAAEAADTQLTHEYDKAIEDFATVFRDLAIGTPYAKYDPYEGIDQLASDVFSQGDVVEAVLHPPDTPQLRLA